MSDKIDESGNIIDDDRSQKALEDTLANLKWYSDALAAARKSS
jgi:hypothetical protein